MNIGLLSQWFDPEPGPAAVPGIIGRALSAQGHQVSALTAFPNYPSGRIYAGYRQAWRRREALGDIQITRVPVYPSHDSSVLGRLLNYSSFAASATILGAGALRDADALWVYNSPITVSLPLFSHTALQKRPYLLHVQDIWPDSLFESGMVGGEKFRGVAERLLNRIVRWTENRSARVAVISPGARDLLLSRNPRLDEDKVVYIPNPTNESLFVESSRAKALPSESVAWPAGFVVMYAGAIGEVQGLDTFVQAAKILHSKSPEIQFVFVGDGIARSSLQMQAETLQLKNVHFVGRVEMSEIPSYIAASHIQVVSLRGGDFLRHTMPSKIGSLLASGKPIIGQIAGDAAQVIEGAGAGRAVAPGDAQGLAEAIDSLYRMPSSELSAIGNSGAAYYRANMSAAKVAELISTTLTAAIKDY